MKQYKNKFHQRVLALALALMLCLGMLPMAAFAEDAPEAPAPEGPQVTATTVGDLMALAGGEDGAPVDETPEDADAPEEDETADEDGNTVTTEDAVGKDDAEKLETVPTPAPENTPTPAPLTDEELAGVERPGQSGTVGVKPGEGFATPAPGEDNPENQEVNADEPLYVPTPSPEPEASGTPAASEPPAETEAPDATPGETTGSTIETGSSTVTTEGQTNWEIFYDEETDTYKITYVIDEEAEGDQTLDLSIALGMLNAYAQSGKVQLEKEKAELEAKLAENEAYAKYQEELAEYEKAHEEDMAAVKQILTMYGSGYDITGKTEEELIAEFDRQFGNMFGELAKKPEIPDDIKELEAQMKELEEKYNHRNEADVLQPGDILKFQFDIVSKSGHTYRYKDGSFILATPNWTEGNGSGTTGFDGQELPEEYVDKANYHVTVRAEPIQELLKEAGIDDWGRFNGSWTKYDEQQIKKLLDKYGNDSLQENMNAYLLEYYRKKTGVAYKDIADLVAKNEEARAELSKTATSGNKYFKIDKEEFVVEAHMGSVLYDEFYKNLISFVFGDKEDIDEATGGKKYQHADGSWAYENESWNSKQNYEKMLAEYMQHNAAWVQANDYFKALLKAGVSAEAATWTSFMMAMNLDGELMGNDWQDTKWPWYNSIQLEQRDEDLTINKTDEDGQVITGSETF